MASDMKENDIIWTRLYWYFMEHTPESKVSRNTTTTTTTLTATAIATATTTTTTTTAAAATTTTTLLLLLLLLLLNYYCYYYYSYYYYYYYYHYHVSMKFKLIKTNRSIFHQTLKRLRSYQLRKPRRALLGRRGVPAAAILAFGKFGLSNFCVEFQMEATYHIS